MISILDYGVGNIASIRNALGYLALESRVVSTPCQVAKSAHLILPGVGAYGRAMQILRRDGLDDAIRQHAIAAQRPMLGICLGMQLLLDGSEEGGDCNGLGLVTGSVHSLAAAAPDVAVPHMGWNDVGLTRDSRLLNAEHSGSSFYFVHGYYCRVSDPLLVTGVSRHGTTMDVMLESANVFGCQFHPEKSQRRGLDILARFGAI